MIDLVRSEWVKIRSVRSTVALFVVGVGLTVLVAVLQARSIAHHVDQVANPAEISQHLGDLTVGVYLAVFLFGALGVQVIGQEHRFNTIRVTFVAAPIRWRVLTAKVITVAACVAVVSALLVVLCIGVGLLVLPDLQIDGVDQRLMLGIVGLSVGWAIMGIGVGAIVRQPIAGILVMLGVPFIAETLLLSLFPATAPWLVFQNGIQMAVRTTGNEGSDVALRSVAGGALYFFAVTAVILAVGFVLTDRRDA